jgi:3-oxoacyl-(acyl-carrier-protein) synthase
MKKCEHSLTHTHTGMRAAMSNSFGFGGVNASLVFASVEN